MTSIGRSHPKGIAADATICREAQAAIDLLALALRYCGVEILRTARCILFKQAKLVYALQKFGLKLQAIHCFEPVEAFSGLVGFTGY